MNTTRRHGRVAHWPFHARHMFICNHGSQSCLTPTALSLRTNAIPESWSEVCTRQRNHGLTSGLGPMLAASPVSLRNLLARATGQYPSKSGRLEREDHPATSPQLRSQPRSGTLGPRMDATRQPPGPLHASPPHDACKWSSTCKTEILSNTSKNSGPSHSCLALTAVRRYDVHWRKRRQLAQLTTPYIVQVAPNPRDVVRSNFGVHSWMLIFGIDCQTLQHHTRKGMVSGPGMEKKTTRMDGPCFTAPVLGLPEPRTA